MNRSALFLQPAERRVGRLSLRVEAEEDARRAAILLSDSLHTASMPVVGEKDLLVVRRLSLGRVSLRSSSATLALQMEKALAEVAASAVPFDHAAARGANAIVFRSQGEAIVSLARQNARGFGAAEWFWPVVAPGWSVEHSAGRRWQMLLAAAHELPEAALVAAMVVEEAVHAGAETDLLAAVPPEIAARWLQLAGWSATLPEEPRAVSRLGSKHSDILQRGLNRWSPGDARLIWLATMLAIIEQPSRIADPLLPAEMAAFLRTSAEQREMQRADPVTRRHSPGASSATEKPELARRAESFSMRQEAVPAPSAHDQSPSPKRGACADNSRARFGDRSECAGLLFLLPALEHLGFSTFLQRHPTLLNDEFPAALLCFVGTRVGLKPNDPLALALNGGDRLGTTSAALTLPSAARELLVDPKPRGQMDSLELVWVTALRRYCRRRARIGLASLIRRTGFVSVSRTHLDVSFDLAAADVRVRRSGLDIDPGWVPWLGRVIRFHYLHSDELAG